MVNDFLIDRGLPTITPKDKDGNPILDYTDFRIDRDPFTEDIEELKEWMALLSYLGTSFPANESGGIPSTIYGPGGAVEGRIEVVNF